MLQIFFPFVVLYCWIFLENEEPRIYFKQPSPHYIFKWNSSFTYQIAVEDKEDGSTELGEIAPNEVILKIKYAADQTALVEFLNNENAQASIWRSIVKNNCFNCHALRDKLAGPSFEQIREKYGASESTTNALAQKILKGSKGIWGDSQMMPSHPDMQIDEAKDIVQWLLRNAAEKDLQITRGTEGSIKTKSNPHLGAKAFYVLSAFYRDHGTDEREQKEAEATLTITSEK